MKYSKLKMYMSPKKTKKCTSCQKVIAAKWPHDKCESCLDRDKLEKNGDL